MREREREGEQNKMEPSGVKRVWVKQSSCLAGRAGEAVTERETESPAHSPAVHRKLASLAYSGVNGDSDIEVFVQY